MNIVEYDTGESPLRIRNDSDPLSGHVDLLAEVDIIASFLISQTKNNSIFTLNSSGPDTSNRLNYVIEEIARITQSINYLLAIIT